MPSECHVTGTLYKVGQTGATPAIAANARLTITPVGLGGVALSALSFSVDSDANGQVDFYVAQGARINISGPIVGFTAPGDEVTVPSSSTATFESFVAGAAYDDDGMTLLDEGVALSGRYTTINFVGSGVAAVRASAGVATVTITGGGTNPLTTLGDTIYGGASGVQTRLAGNVLATRKFLRQTGDGAASAAPAWDTIIAADVPDLSGTYSILAHTHSYEPANANIQSHISNTSNPHSVTASQIGLGSVENTALSTWVGSANITTLGTVGTGVWNGTTISLAKGGTGASLSDPGANTLLGWDDTDNAVAFLTLGSGLSYDHASHTLSASGSGGANTALSNLASVSINTSLLPQSGVVLGAQATPFKDLFLYGGGTFGSHSLKLTGTPTGHRILNLPDASLTLTATDGATLAIGGGGTLGSAAYTAASAYLPIGGGTLTGGLLFTDNSFDIGANGATRPRTGYFGTSVVIGTGSAITSSGPGGALTANAFSSTTFATDSLAAHIAGTESFTGAKTFGSNLLLATRPKITTGIDDANGAQMIAFTPTASAVDYFTLINSAAANPATITVSATGSDSNINLALTPKGTGAVSLPSGAVASPALTFGDSGTGLYRPALNQIAMVINASGNADLKLTSGGLTVFNSIVSTQGDIKITNGHVFYWTGNDAGIGRSGAGVVEINNANMGQWAALNVGTHDVGTATVTNGLTIGHQSTGTPAAGLGSAVLFNINSSTTADSNAAQLSARWNVATHASRGADVYLSTVYNAGSLTDRFLFTQDGRFTLPTAGQVNPGTGELPTLAAASIYVKGSKFVIAYNNGGTITYITIPLDGATATWTHSTSAP